MRTKGGDLPNCHLDQEGQNESAARKGLAHSGDTPLYSPYSCLFLSCGSAHVVPTISFRAAGAVRIINGNDPLSGRRQSNSPLSRLAAGLGLPILALHATSAEFFGKLIFLALRQQ